MNEHPTQAELERLTDGTLSSERAAQVRAHVDHCEDCAPELEWLSLERKLFDERAAAAGGDGKDAMWAAIEQRIDGDKAPEPTPARPRPVIWFGAGFAAATAAAVLGFVALADRTQAPASGGGVAEVRDAATPPLPSETPEPVTDRRAVAALDEAEAAYARALDVIEQDYREKRDELPTEVATAMDASFSDARKLMGDAEQAGDDIDARMLLMDAYSSQVHALQDAVDRL